MAGAARAPVAAMAAVTMEVKETILNDCLDELKRGEVVDVDDDLLRGRPRTAL